jgi:flagella basal body P-ring formation protein FlgA
MTRSLCSLLLAALSLTCATPGRSATASPVAGPLTREAFVAALADSFATHFNLEGDLRLELLRSWSAPARVARTWTVDVQEYPSVMASALLTHGRILADGQVAAEFSVTMNAALWRDAWAARQPVPANSSFDPSLLEVRRVDFLREREALPAVVGDETFMFTRSVQPNRLLTWRDLSRRPLVRKGDLVEVAAVDGLLQVTMKGLAMENGAQGDMVTVRNPESRKDFTARVVAQNRVQVRF